MATKASTMRDRLANFFLWNAQAKHGVPDSSGMEDPVAVPVTTKIEHTHKHEGQVASGSSSAAVVSEGAGLLSKLLPYVLAGGLAAGTGAGGTYLLTRPDTPPPPQDGSLLQDLEDRGFHLPQ